MKDATSAEDWDSLKQAHVRAHGNPPIATLSDVANHIEHVARVAGHAHVGIGSDFYGASGDDLVQGLEDVSKFPDLVAELVRRGWDDDDLAKLTWGNMLRVLGQVEAVGALLRREQPPSLMQLDSAE
jgi:membrane dipeptidase